jgi:hypothetical protein
MVHLRSLLLGTFFFGCQLSVCLARTDSLGLNYMSVRLGPISGTVFSRLCITTDFFFFFFG